MLQERLLSPRILHFSRQQLVWECNELVSSESFPNGFPQTWVSHHLAKRINIEAASRDGEQFLAIWRDILERYTSANLTYPSDLLPALSGIAKYIQDLTSTTYLAGIWARSNKEFLIHLGWRSETVALRPTEYRAPSWSWASTNNQIALYPMESPIEGHIESSISNLKIGAKILDAQVVPATSNLTGSVLSGFLLAIAPLNKIFVTPKKIAILNGRNLDMELFLDEPLTTNKIMYTMPLYSFSAIDSWEYGNNDIDIFVYLILTVSKKEPKYYTRCGLGRSHFADNKVPNIWNKIVNGINTPCEEFLDLSIGYKIRII